MVAASRMDGTRSQSPDSWAVSSSGSGSNPCGTPAQAASPQAGEADARSGRPPDRRSRSRSRGRPGSVVIMRADRGLAVGPYSRTAEQPPTIPGCEWWQAPLWTAHEGQRIKLPARPLRPIRYESLCSGTLGELVGSKATSHPHQPGPPICSVVVKLSALADSEQSVLEFRTPPLTNLLWFLAVSGRQAPALDSSFQRHAM